MDSEDSKMTDATSSLVNGEAEKAERGGERMFTLKKWNAVAMWSWDVECDTCAICRVQVSIASRGGTFEVDASTSSRNLPVFSVLYGPSVTYFLVLP